MPLRLLLEYPIYETGFLGTEIGKPLTLALHQIAFGIQPEGMFTIPRGFEGPRGDGLFEPLCYTFVTRKLSRRLTLTHLCGVSASRDDWEVISDSRRLGRSRPVKLISTMSTKDLVTISYFSICYKDPDLHELFTCFRQCSAFCPSS